jgi:Flp pilus assembly pilin Flp
MRRAGTIWTNAAGATSIEYALIASLIAMAAMGSTALAGNALGNTLTTASNQLNNAPALHAKG